jgi:hypothetical protein
MMYLSVAQIVATYDRVINELWTEKSIEGVGRGLIWNAILAFDTAGMAQSV